MVDLFSLQEAKPKKKKNKQPDEREVSTIVSHAPVAMSLRVWVVWGGSCLIPLSHFTPTEKCPETPGDGLLLLHCYENMFCPSPALTHLLILLLTRQSVIPYSYLNLFSVHQHDLSTSSRPAPYKWSFSIHYVKTLFGRLWCGSHLVEFLCF